MVRQRRFDEDQKDTGPTTTTMRSTSTITTTGKNANRGILLHQQQQQQQQQQRGDEDDVKNDKESDDNNNRGGDRVSKKTTTTTTTVLFLITMLLVLIANSGRRMIWNELQYHHTIRMVEHSRKKDARYFYNNIDDDNDDDNNNNNNNNNNDTVGATAATSTPTRTTTRTKKTAHDTSTRMIVSGSTFDRIPSVTTVVDNARFQKQYVIFLNGKQITNHRHHHHHRNSNEQNTTSRSNTTTMIHVFGNTDFLNENDRNCTNNKNTHSSSIPNTTSRNNNYIVTAYYEIPSKHPITKYQHWMKNLLSKYEDPMIIYTSPSYVSKILQLRQQQQHPTTTTIIIGVPLEELPIAQLYPKSFWLDQLARDPQAKIHSPITTIIARLNNSSNSNNRSVNTYNNIFDSGQLYWIWLSKVWFLQEAVQILKMLHESNGREEIGTACDEEENIFAWIDIGSCRESDTSEKEGDDAVPFAPNLFLRHPEVVPRSEMLFWSHHSSSSSQKKTIIETTKKDTTTIASRSNTTTITTAATKSKSNKKNRAKYVSYVPEPPRPSPYLPNIKTYQGGKYFFHAGSHFAGYPSTIQKLYSHFLHTMDIYIERNISLADDQAIFQSACLTYYKYNAGSRNNQTNNDNLCAYATRHLTVNNPNENNNNNSNTNKHYNKEEEGRKRRKKKLHKWFGLRTVFENGLNRTSSSSRPQPTGGGDTNSSDDDTNSNLAVFYKYNYWRPPPREYYIES